MRRKAFGWLGLVCGLWYVGHASAGTTRYVADWAELVAANTAAADGDTIVLAAGTYTQAAVLTVTKSLTFAGAGAATTIIAENAADAITATGQAGGSTQAWSGITFDRQTNNVPAFIATGTGGHLTIAFTECVFINSGNDNGLTMDTEAAAANNLTATVTRCIAHDNGNDGFNIKQGAGATGNAVCTLIDCDSYDNTGDGASPHGNSTITVYGGTYVNNAKNALVNTDAGSVLDVYDAYCYQGAGAVSHLTNCANTATATYRRCVFEGVAATNYGLVTAGGGDVTLYNCTLRGTAGDTALLRAAGGTLTAWDCTMSATGTYAASVTNPMWLSSTTANSKLYVYRCTLDAYAATVGSGHVLAYARNPMNLEGCVLIQGNIAGDVATSTCYAAQHGAGSSGSVVHCTIRVQSTDQRPNGVYLEVDGIVCRGNLILNPYWGFRAGAANFYDGVAGTGYNVILGAVNDTVYNDDAMITDVVAGDAPTFIDSTSPAFDLRLLTRGVAADVDPNDAYLISYDGYDATYLAAVQESGGVGTELDAGAYTIPIGYGLTRYGTSGVHAGATPVAISAGVMPHSCGSITGTSGAHAGYGRVSGANGVHAR